jgi:2-oxoglutarate ferredoxin oxidoreductase subunit gamma
MSQIATPDTRIHHELIIAGFGGQGVLKLGLALAEAAMHEGREVSWIPSYGPETRGGSSFCTVVISTDPIGSPVVDQVDTAIIMDRVSLLKYQQRVRAGGMILVNTSLIDASLLRTDIMRYGIDANRLAEEIGDQRTGNMVLLGALLHLTHLVEPRTVIAALGETLSARNRHLLPMNERALALGAEQVQRITDC